MIRISLVGLILFSFSLIVQAAPANSDIIFILDNTYPVGANVPVKIKNVGNVAYRYNPIYEACKMTYTTANNQTFIIPPGTHCDLVFFDQINPGETKTLFSWNLDECTNDQWGCLESEPLPPGQYTVSGSFKSVDGSQTATATDSFNIHADPNAIIQSQEQGQCYFDACLNVSGGPACMAPIQIVLCSDPRCNIGPCGSDVVTACNGGNCDFDEGGSGAPVSSGNGSAGVGSITSSSSNTGTSADPQVSQAFLYVFGRGGTPAELAYWHSRDKRGEALEGAMQWHRSQGQSMPGQTLGAVAGASTLNLVPLINSIFRSVYHHEPTVSENQYWLTRIPDKSTEPAMAGAMRWHLLNGITH